MRIASEQMLGVLFLMAYLFEVYGFIALFFMVAFLRAKQIGQLSCFRDTRT